MKDLIINLLLGGLAGLVVDIGFKLN